MGQPPAAGVGRAGEPPRAAATGGEPGRRRAGRVPSPARRQPGRRGRAAAHRPATTPRGPRTPRGRPPAPGLGGPELRWQPPAEPGPGGAASSSASCSSSSAGSPSPARCPRLGRRPAARPGAPRGSRRRAPRGRDPPAGTADVVIGGPVPRPRPAPGPGRPARAPGRGSGSAALVGAFLLSPLHPATWRATAAIVLGFWVELVAFIARHGRAVSSGASLLVIGVGFVVIGIAVEGRRLVARIERRRASLADPRPLRPHAYRPVRLRAAGPALRRLRRRQPLARRRLRLRRLPARHPRVRRDRRALGRPPVRAAVRAALVRDSGRAGAPAVRGSRPASSTGALARRRRGRCRPRRWSPDRRLRVARPDGAPSRGRRRPALRVGASGRWSAASRRWRRAARPSSTSRRPSCGASSATCTTAPSSAWSMLTIDLGLAAERIDTDPAARGRWSPRPATRPAWRSPSCATWCAASPRRSCSTAASSRR